MNIDGAAPRRQPLATPNFTVADGQDPFRPVGDQGLRRGRPRKPSPPSGTARGPLSQPVRFLRAGRPGSGRPRGRGIADQGRGLRLARRPPLAVVAGDRSGLPGRGRRGRPIAAAGRKGSSTTPTTRPTRPAGRQPARRSRVGPARTCWPAKRKCWAFTFPAIRWPNTCRRLKTYCSHTTVEAAALKHRSRSDAGRDDFRGQALATPRTPGPAAPARYAMFDLEDTGRHHALHPLAGAVRAIRRAGSARRGRGWRWA